MDCKATTDSLETGLKLLVIVRACTAAAHSESSLRTSFLDGGAFDVFAAVIIGGDSF